MRPAAALLLCIVITLAGGRAHAVLITWTLQNVTFSDGGRASGFVQFDPSAPGSQHLANFDIRTTAGTALSEPFEYTRLNTDASRPYSVHLFSAPGTVSPRHGLPQRWLDLQPVQGFPTTGGLVEILADASGETLVSADPEQDHGISSRVVDGGFMFGVPVPEPSHGVFISGGLVFLALAYRQRPRPG
jgi:hypothetical protein